jgi:c-di-GMP-binding flagellar brake protein YcgR
MTERRRYKRFTATAFLRMPVHLSPVPPFFGRPVKGQLIDLSACGMALVIDEVIPLNTKLQMSITFPDHTVVQGTGQIRRIVPKGAKYLIGVEFQFVAEEMSARIDKMSTDYIDCETRIAEKKAEVCRMDCAFYSMCQKTQKLNPTLDVDVALELAFKILEESAVS